MTITSPHNEQLKEVRKLAGRKWRDKLRLFVAEGEDLIEAAARAGWAPEALYAAEGSGLEGVPVAPHVLATVSQLGSGTRALGVYGQRWAEAPAGPVCLALWGVNDPGNVGTALRSALAFGAGSVALGPGSADPYGPKAVRASMGAIFEVPVARVRDVAELPGRRIALVAREGEPLHSVMGSDLAIQQTGNRNAGLQDLTPVTVVVGAEREGLPDAVVAACDEVAHIPIRSESLNAGMAATVALYELDRRIRGHA
jgi:TrmH family RNA methyltransferase